MDKQLEYYQQWKTKAHSIFNSAYSNAIANYNRQKDIFLKQLGIEQSEEAMLFIQRLNEQIDAEIDNDIDAEFDKIFDSLGGFIENFYAQAIISDNPSDALNQLKQHFDSLLSITSSF